MQVIFARDEISRNLSGLRTLFLGMPLRNAPGQAGREYLHSLQQLVWRSQEKTG